MSRLEVITGPMFSGKTEELIRRLTRHQIAGKEVLAIKPQIDNRYAEDAIVSHSGGSFEALVIPESGIVPDDSDYRSVFNKDVVAFDEIQFFGENHVEWLIQDLLKQRVMILVAGLDKDAWGEPFGKLMPKLLAISDDVTKLTAVCHVCGEDATMTQKLGEPDTKETQVEVGGLELYEARCRDCWKQR
jgi:thymidine kinase